MVVLNSLTVCCSSLCDRRRTSISFLTLSNLILIHPVHCGPPRCDRIDHSHKLHEMSNFQISNAQLKERISAFGSGLVRFTGLVPHEDNVLLLLNDGLGVALPCIAPFPLLTSSSKNSSSATLHSLPTLFPLLPSPPRQFCLQF
jgi:hypothetical protein